MTSTPRAFSVKLLCSLFSSSLYQCMWLVTLAQVQHFTFFTVEFYKILVCPFLLFVKIPLNSSTLLSFINHFSSICVHVCKQRHTSPVPNVETFASHSTFQTCEWDSLQQAWEGVRHPSCLPQAVALECFPA